MRIEYQLSENGTHTGFRSAQMESAQEPTTALGVYQLADSTAWGDLTLLIGLPHSRVMRALTIGLEQIAADEGKQRQHEAWLATLAKPAYVEKLIADQDWEALYQLQDQGKLHPQYDAQIPLRGHSQTVVTLDEPATVNENTALIEATTVEFSGWTPSLIMAEPEPEPQPQPQLSTPAPTPASAPVKKPSAPAKKPSAKSGGATASARSKRSSVASKRPSSPRVSSRVKSIAG